MATLNKDVFGLSVENHELIKLAYDAYLANSRSSHAKTMTRAEVSGGGKKPWKQKGTGRARFGSTRNPIWRHGGVAFGRTGEENFAKKITKFAVLRYTLLPLMAVFFLGNPMCYTFGRFVDEKYKPAYYDATVSFVHPITGLFPHANAGELFVFLGIATGLQEAGLSTGGLAVRYFIVGLIVILIRGLLTERIYAFMTRDK